MSAYSLLRTTLLSLPNLVPTLSCPLRACAVTGVGGLGFLVAFLPVVTFAAADAAHVFEFTVIGWAAT
jgi:hypothetical protein